MATRNIEITLVGYFPQSESAQSNGEAQKGLNVIRLLREHNHEVNVISTAGWRRRPFSLLFRFRKACKRSKNLLIVTSNNGARVFTNLGRRFGGRALNIVYLMVGIGILRNVHKKFVLPSFAALANDRSVWRKLPKDKYSRALAKANHIAVETPKLGQMYQCFFGFQNTVVLTNFRFSEMPKTLAGSSDGHINLVYFSRIVQSKGLSDLVDATKMLPENIGAQIKVHVYGPNDNPWATSVIESFPPNIIYKGNLAKNKIQTLHNYDAFVFPSRDREGIPGALVEALFAGLPVISSKFGLCDEILRDGFDSLIYTYQSAKSLADKIKQFVESEPLREKLKNNALLSARKFVAEDSYPVLQSLLVAD